MFLLSSKPMTVQERQRQGIAGIHMDCLDEHMDRPQLQRLLGEVLHRSRPFLNGPAPPLPALTEVMMSRCGIRSSCQSSVLLYHVTQVASQSETAAFF